ncbi:MAG: hypothetical protein WCK02_06225 [Bacteroidota bacterium]
MRKILFFAVILSLTLSSCGKVWVQGANKTFGQKKQKKKYGKKRNKAAIFEFNKNKKSQYC